MSETTLSEILGHFPDDAKKTYGQFKSTMDSNKDARFLALFLGEFDNHCGIDKLLAYICRHLIISGAGALTDAFNLPLEEKRDIKGSEALSIMVDTLRRLADAIQAALDDPAEETH